MLMNTTRKIQTIFISQINCDFQAKGKIFDIQTCTLNKLNCQTAETYKCFNIAFTV